LGHTSNVSSYQRTSFKKNDQIEDVIFVDDEDIFSQFPTLTTQTIYPNISSSFNNNIQQSYEETFGNFVPLGDQDLSPLGNQALTLLGDQSFAPEFPTPTSQTICPNVSPYQETFNNNIQRSYKETIENFVPFGDQGLVPEFSTPNTHLLSPHILYGHASPTSELFVPLTIQPLYPHVFAYNDAPTLLSPLAIFPASDGSIISPNITLSKDVQPNWVQMSNYSNHLIPPVLKSHHKRYQRWTENEHRYLSIKFYYFGFLNSIL